MWNISQSAYSQRSAAIQLLETSKVFFEHSIGESVECIEGLTAESLAGEK
jgi:hypothetical protein